MCGWMSIVKAYVVGEALLATVQAAASRAKAFGNFIEVKAPSLVGVEMTIGLNLMKRGTQREEDALVSRVKDVLYRYINSLDINEALDPALISRTILRLDSNIKSIGTPTRPIEYLYIWKFSAAEDNRVRRLAMDGYQAKNFERIVVEYSEIPSGGDPISVRIVS